MNTALAIAIGLAALSSDAGDIERAVGYCGCKQTDPAWVKTIVYRHIKRDLIKRDAIEDKIVELNDYLIAAKAAVWELPDGAVLIKEVKTDLAGGTSFPLYRIQGGRAFRVEHKNHRGPLIKYFEGRIDNEQKRYERFEPAESILIRPITALDIEIGTIGKLSDRCRVVQRVDDSTAIVTMRDRNYWLTGYDMRGVADDDRLTLGGFIGVFETHEYISVIGAKRTLLKIECLGNLPEHISVSDDK